MACHACGMPGTGIMFEAFTNNTPSQSLYNLRVFNYNSNPDTTKTLNIDHGIYMKMANTQYNSTYNQYGYKNYGDGTAKANAKFLNGLVVSQGQYLNSQGQPSSFTVLQNQQYNNYTYELTVSKEIEKYRSVLLNIQPQQTKSASSYKQND